MTRGKKLLLLLILLIAVCAAAVVATLLNPDVSEGDDTEETIFALDSADLTNVSWNYNGEELSFDYDSETEIWSYAPDADFPLADDTLNLMIAALEDVSVSRTLETAVEDISAYGLDDPMLTVTVATGINRTTFTIGDETALGGEVYLMMSTGSDDEDASTIYLVDSSFPTFFTYGLYDLVATEDIPIMSDIYAFTMEGDTQNYTLHYLEDSGITYTDKYVWYMADDEGYIALDTDLTETLIANVSNLSWSSCINYKATDDELAAYGLDAPSVMATVYYTVSKEVDTGEVDEDGEAITETQESKETFALEFGSYYTDADGNSCCYARIAGSRMVYLVSSAICDTLLYTTSDDLLPDEVILMNWDDVTQVDVTLNSTDYTFLRTTVTTENEDGETVEEKVFQLDGITVELEDILKALESVSTTGSAASVTPERSTAMTMTFHQEREGYETVTLTFYVYDSDTYLVQLNGESTLFADVSDVDGIISDLESAITGEGSENETSETGAEAPSD